MNHEDHIKARAHQIWEQEGKPDGAHEEHWRRAEEELDIHGTSGEVGGMLGGQAQTEPTAPAVSPEGGSGAAIESPTKAPGKA